MVCSPRSILQRTGGQRDLKEIKTYYWDANCHIALLNSEPTTDAVYLSALECMYGDMIDGEPRYRLATLIFCLEVALDWQMIPPGIWQSVNAEMAEPGIGTLLVQLRMVNAFRNQWVTHEGNDLRDPEIAPEALSKWTRCLSLMYLHAASAESTI